MQCEIDFGQRWTNRRSSFRLRASDFDPSRYTVDVLPKASAQAFVEQHHYSGSYPAARKAVGLFDGRECVGVAVFSVPAQNAVIPKWLGCPAGDGIELGRFVLLDRVPFNAETWFLRRAFTLIRQELKVVGVVAYSDPVRREALDGSTVMPGHVGTIYKAFNGAYLGRGSPRTLLLDAAGRVFSARALSKIRNEERGIDYALRQLVEAGAPVRLKHENPRVYVARVLASDCFRRIPHPGNHVYAWHFGKKLDSLAFPVLEVA
jgi:hypothetical protein